MWHSSICQKTKKSRQWIENIGRHFLLLSDKYLKSHYQVCSKHFSSNQFKKNYPRIILKPGSVPITNENFAAIAANINDEHNFSLPAASRNEKENVQGKIIIHENVLIKPAKINILSSSNRDTSQVNIANTRSGIVSDEITHTPKDDVQKCLLGRNNLLARNNDTPLNHKATTGSASTTPKRRQ